MYLLWLDEEYSASYLHQKFVLPNQSYKSFYESKGEQKNNNKIEITYLKARNRLQNIKTYSLYAI